MKPLPFNDVVASSTMRPPAPPPLPPTLPLLIVPQPAAPPAVSVPAIGISDATNATPPGSLAVFMSMPLKVIEPPGKVARHTRSIGWLPKQNRLDGVSIGASIASPRCASTPAVTAAGANPQPVTSANATIALITSSIRPLATSTLTDPGPIRSLCASHADGLRVSVRLPGSLLGPGGALSITRPPSGVLRLIDHHSRL